MRLGYSGDWDGPQIPSLRSGHASPLARVRTAGRVAGKPLTFTVVVAHEVLISRRSSSMRSSAGPVVAERFLGFDLVRCPKAFVPRHMRRKSVGRWQLHL